MKIKILIIALATLIFVGCQSPGVIELSQNTYLISKSSAAGAFANLPQMKADVIKQANEFAASKGKEAVEISLQNTVPTFGFPSVDYQFKLVDKTNSVATPPK